jgi:DNA repair protein RadC
MKSYKQVSIKNWAVEDRPREKLMQRGIEALTDTELLAILLATGTRDKSALDLARDILTTTGGLARLARIQINELTRIKGIGKAKAISIQVAFEMGRRKQRDHVSNQRFSNSREVAQYISPKLVDLNHEVFYAIFLNRNNEVIAEKEVFSGGVSATIIDPRIIFREAINYLASGIIFAHNHPSGNLKPSQADIEITHKLKKGGKVFDINVLDHLIISNRGYYSFADEGNMG